MKEGINWFRLLFWPVVCGFYIFAFYLYIQNREIAKTVDENEILIQKNQAFIDSSRVSIKSWIGCDSTLNIEASTDTIYQYIDFDSCQIWDDKWNDMKFRIRIVSQ